MRFSLLTVAALATAVSAATPNPFFSGPIGRALPLAPKLTHNEDTIITGNDTGIFEQLIDHNNPHLGTFNQSFWFNATFWKGPGSPVVLFTPGEAPAAEYTGYLTTRALTGIVAEAIGAAVVMIEHRYWGDSSPYDDLTTKNMQYLTIENAVQDLVYFSKNVDLPFDTKSSSNAPHAPWVIIGGSYSGALSAWTESVAPGTFWAYHASSAPVEAVFDYWQYFYPIQDGMAKNCSTDMSAIITKVDSILKTGTKQQKHDLKAMFGLQNIQHDDDFAAVLPIGPYLWQSNSFYTGYSGFFQFCDAVENVTAGAAVTPGAGGVGVDVALPSFAYWINSTVLPGYCASYGYEEWQDEWNVDCFNSYNASSPIYTDMTVSNPINRQWMWYLCNQPFAYWQDGAPKGTPSIVSTLVTAQYWQRQCPLYFPKQGKYNYGSAEGATVSKFNAWTKGWNLENTKRLIFINGQYDPWRTAGVSSQFRPGGPMVSTSQEPIDIIPGGFHCSDLIAKNGQVNAGVQSVIDSETQQIKTWVSQFYTSHGRHRSAREFQA